MSLTLLERPIQTKSSGGSAPPPNVASTTLSPGGRCPECGRFSLVSENAVVTRCTHCGHLAESF